MIAALEKNCKSEVSALEASVQNYTQVPARQAYSHFLFSAVAIVALGVRLSSIGDRNVSRFAAHALSDFLGRFGLGDHVPERHVHLLSAWVEPRRRGCLTSPRINERIVPVHRFMHPSLA